MLRKFMTGFVVLTVFLAVAVTANAGGGSDFSYSMTDASGSPGDTVVLTCLLDNPGGDLQGWSFGSCTDPADLTVIDAQDHADTDLLMGTGGFSAISIYAGGPTQGIVLDFFGIVVLPAGTVGFGMLDVTYDIVGATTSCAEYCSTLGAPPVSAVVVYDGASVVPAMSGGCVNVINPNQLIADDVGTILGGSAASTLSLNNVTMPAVDAVQMNVVYDSAIITNTGVDAIFAAEVFLVQTGGILAGEIVMGMIADQTPPLDNLIPAGAQTDLVSLGWDSAGEGTSAITWTDGIGTPPQDNKVVTGQTTQAQPTLVHGSVSVVNYNVFLRSDCNNDAIVNIADGVFGLNFLFQGGPDPTCDDACDSNDDGAIDSSDMIFIFNYRFLEGAAPLAPFPVADLDPTNGDGLGCDGDADDI